MSTQNLDLVVSELDEAKDDDLAKIIESWHENERAAKWERAQTWSQNIHFLAGNQWLLFNHSEKRWETFPITEQNQHIDRPTTNHINRWTRMNASSFTNKPNNSIEPNSEEPQDKTAAKVSEAVMAYLWEEHQKTDQYYECALWSLVSGLTARKSVKRLTGMKAGDVLLKMVDSYPVSPFNITFDGIPSRFRDIGIVMESDLCRVDQTKEEFAKSGDGYTGRAADLKEEKLVSSILSLKEGLKDIVSGSQGFSRMAKDGDTIKDSLIKKEVYVRPSKKYPQGRMIVVASGIVLYKGVSPYFYQNGRYWHPYTFCNYEKMPGNLWGLDFVQRLVPLQRRINSIDALIAYNRKTIAVPWILNPLDSGIKPGEKVGVPGQQIDYEPSPTGARPEVVPGTALPAQVMDEREMCIRDGDLLAMAGDIRSGKNPTGVNTLGQLQILSEQSELSRSRQIEDWEKFIEESEKLDLLNFQSCYQAPEEEVNSAIQRHAKSITKFEWKIFKGSDLHDNVTVRVEKGSTLAKSRLVRQGLVLQLAEKGYLGDFMSDPFKYKEFLAELGLGNLFSEENVDVVMAERCNEMMLEGEYPPVLEQYNPDIHIRIVARYMKQPRFLELPIQIRKLFMKRFDYFANELRKYPTVADDEIEGETQESNVSVTA